MSRDLAGMGRSGARRPSLASLAAVLRGRYGSAVDGAKTVAGTETETQHRAFTELIVPVGTIYQPAGWIITARRKITIAGTVRRNGVTATTGTAAANITGNAFGGASNSPAAGGTGAGGSPTGSTANPYYGGAGGAGGAGSGGAGGTPAAFSVGATFVGLPDADPWCLLAMRLATSAVASIAWATGQGGAGGGGNGVQTGGGGGSVAGGILLVAPVIEIVGGGLLTAIGGDGAPGQASDCGGGGPGGGGVIGLLCDYLIETGTVSCAAGSPGASGGGAGVIGGAGAAGKIYRTGVA